jgi:cyclopropane-fatty-acyl-phospholipid synthase
MSGWFERVFQGQVERILSGWREPELVLRLPDGRERRFGDGTDRAVEVVVHSAAFYRSLAFGGDAGPGESYVAGDWSSPDLASLIAAFLRNRQHLALGGRLAAPVRLARRAQLMLRRNTRRGSARNIHAHYDIGNEFFRLFLDPTLTYSSGIFLDETSTLDEAQINKYRTVCEKLKLRKEDCVLEIGSGWGGFAVHAASEIGCRITTITISREQFAYAKQLVREARLEDLVDVRRCDYRDVEGRYDKIVSIEMLEAVGREYWDGFFANLDRVLSPHGLVLLQVICVPDQSFASYRRGVDWVRKHIFPGGLLPSVFELQRSIRRVTRLELHHLEEIGSHYARTLASWRERFWKNADAVRALGFDEPFLRLWDFYLAACEASFSTHWNRDVQLVLTRPLNPLLGNPREGR